MKENLEFERKKDFGRYHRNMTQDGVGFFYMLSPEEQKALNLYDKNGKMYYIFERVVLVYSKLYEL